MAMGEYTEYPALHVAVKADLWRRACKKEPAALEELRKLCHGLVLYEHILSVTNDEVFVALDDLYACGAIKALRLYNEIPSD